MDIRYLMPFLIIVILLTAITHANKNNSIDLTVINQQGIRVIFNDSEFYFNASNGGEITEYYDLTTDPLRNRNLANINIPGWLQGNLWPLFTSAIYNPYIQSDYSTGGDPNATVSLVEETNDRIVIYVTSRMMNRIGWVVKDTAGSPVYINTTWTFNKKNGLIFVERTFNTHSSFNFPAGWRWYPFYFTRNKGFAYNGTFYFFNTTHTKSAILNDANYVNRYDKFPVFPDANNDTFGVAMPFSNTDIEGDGTQNVIIVYNYNKKMLNVSEWKSDTSNIVSSMNITWAGAVHEFSMPVNVTTHTYNAVIHFTHKAINKNDGINYARYIDSLYPFMEVNLITDRDIYYPGDTYTISASGVSYYNLNNISSKLTAADDGGVYFEQQYNPHNYAKGDTFSYVLFNGYILPNEPTGYRTFTLQFVSQTGAIIASDSKIIIIAN